MKKVLVANRGEIACRVIGTLRECSIASVAVYSAADRNARHVRIADEAVEIGQAPATESYLAIPRLLEAAKRTRADAVHPGYGFLAENAAFAKAVEEAGLTFLGPSSETIALFGDKRRAREVARRAGIPVVPGWEGGLDEREEAAEAASRMGWPVLVKAALGGGGKGMAKVVRSGDLASALEAASRIASSAFRDPSVYLEKAIEKPRHVEVQILGDGKGEVLHLGERDCTLQRRHQKVVEETPAATISNATREKLTRSAVAIGKAVQYRSLGTCEFLVDSKQRFFFLEVNARIQVEHPVTELVTGRDLVHEQISLATRGRLAFSQQDVSFQGAAVEARIYAEDPDLGFVPQAGKILRAQYPRGPFLRVDFGVETGDSVPPHYDPLLAKVAASGRDRAAAWERLSLALRETVMHGPTTNLDFLRELFRRDDVLRGDTHTEFLEDTFLPGRARRLSQEDDSLFLAAAALADAFGLAETAESSPGAAAPAGRRRPSDPFDVLSHWRHPGLGGDAR